MAITYKFSGHESFPCKSLWLKKDMVTNRGTNVRTQTYVLPEKDKSKADDLEQKINKMLSGDTNIDVCALLSILNKKIK